MKSIVQTHTFCTTQVDKNVQNETLEAESQGYKHVLNRTYCNGVGGRTTHCSLAVTLGTTPL